MNSGAPRHRCRVIATLWLALAAGCAPAPKGGEPFSVREITPAFLLPLECRDPSLAADAHGHVAVTWVTRDSSGGDVWISVSHDTRAPVSNPTPVKPADGPPG